MSTERALRNLVLQAASRQGARLFRVNTGQAWAGKVTHLGPGRVLIDDAYPIRMGLVGGGSDLIGWTPINGQAVFTAVELKTGRQKATLEQANFLAAVQSAGGLAGVARTVAEAEAIIRGQAEPSMAGQSDGAQSRPVSSSMGRVRGSTSGRPRLG